MTKPPTPSPSQPPRTTSSPLIQPHTPRPPPLNTIRHVIIIIRFSQSHPDIPLTIPHTLKIRRIKQLIRTQLPSEQQNHGLRLIHGGRLLSDDWTAAKALKLHGEPRVDVWREGTFGSKGKEKARDEELERVYVHCSVSAEPVSPGVLAADGVMDSDGEGGGEEVGDVRDVHGQTSLTETGEAPARSMGFDRLLSGTSSFSPADVASLRAHFYNVISARHTPDTMPSPTTLRRMEDNWLDTESFAGTTTHGETGVTVPTDDEDAAAAIYDSFYGVVFGFFWPLGALVWGLREEGVWSGRRSFAVLAGVGLNVGFGLIRVLS